MTGTATSSAPAASAKRRRPRVIHWVDADAEEFATAHSLQVRTLCGRWMFGRVPSATQERSGSVHVCKTCQRAGAAQGYE